MKLTIYIATHTKPYKKIKKHCYEYVGCGPNKRNLFVNQLDDSFDDNIGDKNLYYSELTVHYWIWKNIKTEYVGLMHYRRWFVNDKGKLYSEQELEKILEKKDILVTKPEVWEKSVEEQYFEYRKSDELEDTRSVLERLFPDYVEYFDIVMKSHSLHAYNMLITKKSIFDEYSSFLFAVLFELEKKYGTTRKRLYGYISERLLDVFILKHSHYSIGELDLKNLKKPFFRRLAEKIKKK